MIDAAEAAQSFVAGRRRVDLDVDRMLLFALVRAVGILGEAASRMTPAARAAAPDVPWLDIVALRDRLAAADFDTDRDLLWQTVVDEIPPVLARLRSIASKP
jgi:uncharacterized protein with HEPN domain